MLSALIRKRSAAISLYHAHAPATSNVDAVMTMIAVFRLENFTR